MAYGDEKIIAAKVANMEHAKLSIAKRVEINDIIYEFETRNIDDKFSMTLPTNFDKLPPDLAEKRYQSPSKLKTILSNPDSTVSIFFNCSDKDTATPLLERITQRKMAVKRMNQSYVFSSVRAGSQLAYFDFRSHTIGEDMYNLWFLVDLPNNTVFGGFSCPMKLQSQWQPLVLQMLQTITALT